MTAAPHAPTGQPTRSSRLAVWDVDRTLTTSDTLLPFLRAVLGPRALALILRGAALAVVRRGGGRAEFKDALLRGALAGWSEVELEALALRYAQSVLETGCRPDSLSRWAWHQRCGDVLALASASPGVYVRPLGALLGADHVVATELECTAGHLTGARSTLNCRGPEKARRVNDLIADVRPASVWAYGDSRSDLATLALALADVPVRIRAYRRLTTPPHAFAAMRAVQVATSGVEP
ncbi:phosphatidylglycerophosphatase C [Sanguibacter gelidistatuariae]|uniref:Phosphatidylglycerophosphatase C n=1 Tax=Sanguibacter gelidistatuariae TaxID=1814289 RepID=A0A1G6XJJ5_9MICO|nr:HAD-IB family hydrolase [Sanguibacter gelidistatuariae]SDD77953.1 phosphatidylglycerophosphatase C [Sanguibacter gelidistatuariae]